MAEHNTINPFHAIYFRCFTETLDMGISNARCDRSSRRNLQHFSHSKANCFYKNILSKSHNWHSLFAKCMWNKPTNPMINDIHHCFNNNTQKLTHSPLEKDVKVCIFKQSVLTKIWISYLIIDVALYGNLSLVRGMTWHRIGIKSLPEPGMTKWYKSIAKPLMSNHPK